MRDKSKFYVQKITYLGHGITGTSIGQDPEKLDPVKKCNRPSNTKQLQSFLGFCTYFQKCIRNYSDISASLYDLLRKKVTYLWTQEHEEAFQKLMELLLKDSISFIPERS
ncbi:Retrovirus-related Pol polyprotein from transposon 17.6 [Thelohanellus kitauei]|uniref:Retrovirus-related Pol polyprotein from transposon 17.6 n=1 Tax=Thelohanellus kitauei TaxID=669202 RepID=A0A0C2MT54_THEKT|nr:Retrovirus-related Pol polyprotein from transposon 17.6 [Thelohanellus kitauei]